MKNIKFTFDSLENGDPLERSNADFIRSRLTGYEIIWKNYIGNDGTSKPLKLTGCYMGIKRQRFCQYHYTCLESIICMKQIAEKKCDFDYMDLKENTYVENYISLINQFIAFHSHAGRVRDMVREIGFIWELSNISCDLEEYYQRRNTVLHDSKLPFGIVSGAMSTMFPMGEIDDNSKWGGEMSWDEVDANNFIFMSTYLDETFNEIVNILNNQLNSLFSKKIEPYLKDKKLEENCHNQEAGFGSMSGEIPLQ